MEGDHELERKNIKGFIATAVRTPERFFRSGPSIPSRELASVCDDGMFRSQ
jgi:hypothetical protein